MTASTGNLRGLLRDRHPPPDWVLAFEFKVEAEDGIRYADAMAFDTRVKRGHALHGFELKVSRADLRHELNVLEKHKPAAALTDYWWLVLGDRALLKSLAEVPSQWGLLAPGETGALCVVRPAARLLPDHVPDLIPREVMAGILRRFTNQDYSPEAYWRDQVRKAEQKGIAKGRNMASRTSRAKDRAPARWADKEPLNLP